MSELPTDRFRRLDAILDEMLDLPDAERTSYIERVSGNDDALREELFGLLRAHRRTGGLLESPAADLAWSILDDDADAVGLPEQIGAFRIVRRIGRGGMGDVFLGERADGHFEQRVALKLIRGHAHGLVTRFLEERRILAMLEHPCIARLIDGGITRDGQPYFAMEFVDGEPIDQYCESRKLPLERRLDLFADVCDAVTYAHQHLVVHRDLKPSNILVTTGGQVKLLDFGIAKLLGGQAAGANDTRPELKVMTPEFAAPEQVRGEPISTATDVYALGVLLYMLLASTRPYSVQGRSAAEIEWIVCEQEPPRPSSRVQGPLARRLRGDLDLIVMTAMQKREDRRYRSPAALALDLQRYRDGQPILARPDSARYRLSRFVARHRMAVAAAALLVTGLTGAALRERVLRNRAVTEARKAKEIEEFLVRVFDVADPYTHEDLHGGSITARELLDRGAVRIDSTLGGQPEIQAELRSVLGRVYASLGLFDRAVPMFERSLAQRRALYGPVHASVASDMDLLGAALVSADRYAEAEPLLRGALEQRRRTAGNVSIETAGTLEHLATLLQQRGDLDAAEPLYREVVAIRATVPGDSSVEFSNALTNLGLLLYLKGQDEEAESLYRRSLDISVRRLGENHPFTAETLQNLAQLLQRTGSLDEAETFHRRALAAKRKTLGDEHPSVTISLNNLGNLLVQMGRLDDAESLVREALTTDRKMFGETHSYVAASLKNLAVILRLKGELVRSDSMLVQALAIDRTLFGEPHEAVALDYGQLASTRFLRGDDAGATALMRTSLEQYRRSLGEEHLNTIITAGNLGNILSEAGDPVEAESILRSVLARLDPENPAHRTQYAASHVALGKAILAQRRIDDALAVLEPAYERMRAQFGDDHGRTAAARLAYGKALVAKGRYAEAAPLLRAAKASLDRDRRAQPRLAAQADSTLLLLERLSAR